LGHDLSEDSSSLSIHARPVEPSNNPAIRVTKLKTIVNKNTIKTSEPPSTLTKEGVSLPNIPIGNGIEKLPVKIKTLP
jgi:hypothetical protein